MNKAEILEKIHSNIVVPVLRADSAKESIEIAEAIISVGIKSLEVTMTVPNALNVIKDLSEKFGNETLIGAGTVLDVETAEKCLEAGAKFIVTPCLIVEVIEFCNWKDVPVLAGSFTPTEVFTAWKSGADVVKIFPASVGGADYLKALKAPFPQIKMMPTGGVSLKNAEDFLKAGAFALGIGGELVNPKAKNKAERLKKIQTSARKLTKLIEELSLN
jgi:2-dehydro-3-deoxyphosphogluconate aldolase / (4S)-4-hydroxy-2-oxoglutarate aldolase